MKELLILTLSFTMISASTAPAVPFEITQAPRNPLPTLATLAPMPEQPTWGRQLFIRQTCPKGTSCCSSTSQCPTGNTCLSRDNGLSQCCADDVPGCRAVVGQNGIHTESYTWIYTVFTSKTSITDTTSTGTWTWTNRAQESASSSALEARLISSLKSLYPAVNTVFTTTPSGILASSTSRIPAPTATASAATHSSGLHGGLLVCIAFVAAMMLML